MATPATEPSGTIGVNPFGVGASRAPVGSALALGGQDLPLVDEAVLQEMEEELGRSDIAWNFANDYAGMWAERQRRLVESIEHEDRRAALEAVISLKVASVMVGGIRLARLAEAMETAIREGELRDGTPFLAVISTCGCATMKELQRGYLRNIRHSPDGGSCEVRTGPLSSGIGL